MLREMMKSKIHMATVTETDLEYMGSLTIDRDLMDAADLVAGEKVQMVNVNNGSRLETYVIEGERGSGVIGVNGGVARHACVGDVILIMSYCMLDDEQVGTWKSKIVFVDEKNSIRKAKPNGVKPL